jgi:alpha-tubulin suppressor-like RCC1 family protein
VRAIWNGRQVSLWPTIAEGFGEVRARRVCYYRESAYAIGENGDLLSWGGRSHGLLGHGDENYQLLPKRVEALRDVRVSSVSAGGWHALALAEDGVVYAWRANCWRALSGDPHVQAELLPYPVDALQGVRVVSIVVAAYRGYAVADTGELWAWGLDVKDDTPLYHDEQVICLVPKPIEALRGVKVDAVAGGINHTLALADDGSVYSWGGSYAARIGALGLGPSVSGAKVPVRTPRRIPALRVAYGF